MSLERIFHPWNRTEDTPEFNGIPPHTIIMSEIERLKREIECLKGTIINQMKDDMNKIGFYSMYHNTKRIIDVMAPQTKKIMEK